MIQASSKPYDDSSSVEDRFGPNGTTLRGQSTRGHALSTPSELLRVSRLELKRIVLRMAQLPVSGEGRRPLIDPTTLVNEVARRLLGGSGLQELPCHGDFYADLAGAFRRLLRDRAMLGLADKTPMWLAPLGLGSAPQMGTLDNALRRLEEKSPRHAQIAILRLLGGMTDAEIAEQMSLDENRIASGWQSTRNWLEQRLASQQSVNRRPDSKPAPGN